MNTVLFLDLEGTIIDSWSDRNILHSKIDYIKKCLIHQRKNIFSDNITELGLFSYAIDDIDDLITFKIKLQQTIEHELDLKFNPNYILTKKKIQQLYTKVKKIHFKDYSDFNDFCGDKMMTFFSIAHSLLESSVSNAILIDDAVGNANMEFFRGTFFSDDKLTLTLKTRNIITSYDCFLANIVSGGKIEVKDLELLF